MKCKWCGQRIIKYNETWVVSDGSSYFGFCGKAPQENDYRHTPKVMPEFSGGSK